MKTAIFSLVTIVLFFSLAEIVLRFLWHNQDQDQNIYKLARAIESNSPHYLYDPLLLWKIRPYGRTIWLEGANAYINKLGLRSPEIPSGRDRRELRVLCIGDSVTLGYKVPTEQTWTVRLEALLKSIYPDRPVRVINAGVSGYSSSQCLQWLKTEGVALQPDIVTYFSGFNDDRLFFYADNEVIAYGHSAVGWRGFLRHSRLYQLLRALARRGRGILSPGENQRRDNLKRFLQLAAIELKFENHVDYQSLPDYPDYEKEMTALLAQCRARVTPAEYQANLTAMAELSRRHRFGLIFIEPPFQKPTQLPYYLSLKLAFPIERYREEMRQVAAQNGLRCVALPELSEAAAPANERYFADVVHPNSSGCEIMASRISQAIKIELSHRRKSSLHNSPH